MNIKAGVMSDRTEISAKSRGHLHFLRRVLGTFARSKVPLIGNSALQAPKKFGLEMVRLKLIGNIRLGFVSIS
jgi:hypothetical protein